MYRTLEQLGTECKWLEQNFSPEYMVPLLPVIIRLDGNGFSKWTSTLNKPFDERFVDCMIDTAKHLVKITGAKCAYTQSDEISLILYSDDLLKPIYNEGKKQKILSKLTGICVNYFNELIRLRIPEQTKLANFDCRIYQVQNLQQVSKQLLWREFDGIRNSTNSLARAHYSHNELMNMSSEKVRGKLFKEKGVSWMDLPNKFKKGTYLKRSEKDSTFTAEEIALLPPKHNAHSNPDITFKRSVIEEVDMGIGIPKFSQFDFLIDGLTQTLF